jgi:hypothetical protein
LEPGMMGCETSAGNPRQLGFSVTRVSCAGGDPE